MHPTYPTFSIRQHMPPRVHAPLPTTTPMVIGLETHLCLELQVVSFVFPATTYDILNTYLSQITSHRPRYERGTYPQHDVGCRERRRGQGKEMRAKVRFIYFSYFYSF
jgi:hypothetical protein